MNKNKPKFKINDKVDWFVSARVDSKSLSCKIIECGPDIYEREYVYALSDGGNTYTGILESYLKQTPDFKPGDMVEVQSVGDLFWIKREYFGRMDNEKYVTYSEDKSRLFWWDNCRAIIPMPVYTWPEAYAAMGHEFGIKEE